MKDIQGERVETRDASYHVYSVGDGPVVLLLHGYAQTARMWFPLMERWRSKYRIIAPDLKGIGDSPIADSGYDKKSVAAEVKSILERSDIKSAAVIGHDIGLMVAYAFAAQFPRMTEKLVLMDAFLPGIGPGQEIYDSPSIWHFRFNGPYAEKLVEGRERVFLDSLWDGFSARSGAIETAQKERYASLYARPGRMRAGWEYFKAMPRDAKDNADFAKTKLEMPVLTLGGEKAFGQVLAITAKEIAERPSSIVLPGCGHWLMEECGPQATSALEDFLGR